jgi:hypothetical protein
MDAGVSVELFETKSGKKILDGWSLDVFGGSKRCGLGVAKDVFKRKKLEIDAGVYVTKRLKDVLDFKIKPEVSIGLSGQWRF